MGAGGEAADGAAHGTPGWRAELEATLRELASLRARWESPFGHLALLVRLLGRWRDMQFVSFAHYGRERLGLGIRQVEQRIALRRRLHALPSLRTALAEGRLDAEKARLVARVAGEPSASEWIDRAERTPTIALRREVEALLAAAFRAAQRATGPDGRVGWRSESGCLQRVATHFIEAWRDPPRAHAKPQRRAVRRDGHRCQVPGCGRAAVHAHHVRHRSHGGGDDLPKLTRPCAAHHLHGVHRGFVRVQGVAPGGLTWGLGERNGPRLGREDSPLRE